MTPEVARHLLEGFMRESSYAFGPSGMIDEPEFVLWKAAKGEARPDSGLDVIDCDALLQLSEIAEGWFEYCRKWRFLPMTEWLPKYAEWSAKKWAEGLSRLELCGHYHNKGFFLNCLHKWNAVEQRYAKYAETLP